MQFYFQLDLKKKLSAIINFIINKNKFSLKKSTHSKTESVALDRLIMFKECLKYNITPFVITDELKLFYYHGISEWNNLKGFLTDTCLTVQDEFKCVLDWFGMLTN